MKHPAHFQYELIFHADLGVPEVSSENPPQVLGIRIFFFIKHEHERGHFRSCLDETIQRTNLGDLSVGDYVNIERSLKYGDEVGGHLLSGHIFDTGIIKKKTTSGDQMSLNILAPPSIHKYLTEKGYIAVDGISLTVGKVVDGCFDLHIIPETMRLTILDTKEVGDIVNIEIDSNTQLIVETIERLLKDKVV